MRTILLAILFLTCGAAAAQETTTVCIGGRCLLPRARATTVVVHESRPAAVVESYAPAPVVVESEPVEHYHSPQPVTTVVTATPRRVTVAASSGAQRWANHLGATGSYRIVGRRMIGHCPHLPVGIYEGIGCSSVSPEAAVKSCCYQNDRSLEAVETATAWCQSKRQYVAVVRYRPRQQQ
jgi:hypothetical protein